MGGQGYSLDRGVECQPREVGWPEKKFKNLTQSNKCTQVVQRMGTMHGYPPLWMAELRSKRSAWPSTVVR